MIKRKNIKINDQASLLERTATLLQEGYTFSESLQLILPFHSKNYAELLEKIEQLIKDGKGITEIFKFLGFNNAILLMMHVAEKNGGLRECLENSAKQLTYLEETRKKLRAVLAYPALLFLFISALMIGFRQFFLPNLKMISRTNEATSNYFLPDLVVLLPEFFLIILFLFGLGLILGIVCYKRLTAEKKIRFIQRIPIFRRYFFLWKTLRFSSELGQLLESGFSVQDALFILKEQQADLIIQEIAQQIIQLIVRGESLYHAVHLIDLFPNNFGVFIRHGELNGYLGKELLIYSETLTDQLMETANRAIKTLQPILFSIIAICIIAAYLALLLPIYGMLNTI